MDEIKLSLSPQEAANVANILGQLPTQFNVYPLYMMGLRRPLDRFRSWEKNDAPEFVGGSWQLTYKLRDMTPHESAAATQKKSEEIRQALRDLTKQEKFPFEVQ